MRSAISRVTDILNDVRVQLGTPIAAPRVMMAA
jgi:hypothetical protein